MAARNATLIHARKTRQGGTGHRAARSRLFLLQAGKASEEKDGEGGSRRRSEREREVGKAGEKVQIEIAR